MAKFVAQVRKKVQSRRPEFNTYGRQILLDPQGRELPKDGNNLYIGEGIPKFETIETDAVETLCDAEGAPIECETVEELLKAVRKAFEDDEEAEIVSVIVQEIRIVAEIPGAEVMAGS